MKIMEERKRKEIAYYDEQAQHQSAGQTKDFAEFSPVLGSHRFLYKVVAPLIAGKKVLDYGCGEGIHIPFLAKHAAEVVGIDLSEGALRVASKRYEILDTKYKIQLRKMDCEALEFPEHSFDVVFDGGTFSSLDFQKAIEEIVRVLKPGGVLVGIETFGHNPLANAKRVLNRLTGERTAWAASHIVRQKEIEYLKQHFEKCDLRYFHLLSLFAFPFSGLPPHLNISGGGLPGGSFVLRLLEKVDEILLRIPFLQKYAFKVVFVCSNAFSTSSFPPSD